MFRCSVLISYSLNVALAPQALALMFHVCLPVFHISICYVRNKSNQLLPYAPDKTICFDASTFYNYIRRPSLASRRVGVFLFTSYQRYRA